jgi:hypothetical protein
MTQLQQCCKRQARLGNDLHLAGADIGHPGGN